MKFALEPKPNEPRGDAWLPTVGHALHMISTLDRPDLWGVNPEVAHEVMAGLSFSAAVGQALWAGKLFHVDLNAQRIGRYDQDFRFGQEDIKDAFILVRMLEEAGYAGPAPLRRATPARRGRRAASGTSPRGCMRTYLILKEKAQQFAADAEIQAARRAAGAIDAREADRRRRLLAGGGRGAARRVARPGRARRARDAATTCSISSSTELLLGVR